MTITKTSIHMAIAALALGSTLSAHANTLESFTTAAGKTALPGKTKASKASGKIDSTTPKPKPIDEVIATGPTTPPGPPAPLTPHPPAPPSTCARPNNYNYTSHSSPSDTCPPVASHCDTSITTVGDNYQVIRRGAQPGASPRKAVTHIPYVDQSDLERQYMKLVHTPWIPSVIRSGSPTLSNPPTPAQLDTFYRVNYMNYGDQSYDKYFIDFWEGLKPVNGKQICAMKLTLKIRPTESLFITDQFKLVGIPNSNASSPTFRYYYSTAFSYNPTWPQGVFDYNLANRFFPDNTFNDVEFSLWLNDLRPEKRGYMDRKDIVPSIAADQNLGLMIQDDTKVIFSTLEYWLK